MWPWWPSKLQSIATNGSTQLPVPVHSVRSAKGIFINDWARSLSPMRKHYKWKRHYCTVGLISRPAEKSSDNFLVAEFNVHLYSQGFLPLWQPIGTVMYKDRYGSSSTHFLGRFRDTYELLEKSSWILYLNEIPIFQFIGNVFCVEFWRKPLKFHAKYPIHGKVQFYIKLNFEELLD